MISLIVYLYLNNLYHRNPYSAYKPRRTIFAPINLKHEKTFTYAHYALFLFSAQHRHKPAKATNTLAAALLLAMMRTAPSQNYNYDTGVTQYFNNDIVSFNISPEFGFFLSDKWAIGIQPGYSRVSGTEVSNFYSMLTRQIIIATP
jgi:hypothetical protein